jgi:hypothetical protein
MPSSFHWFRSYENYHRHGEKIRAFFSETVLMMQIVEYQIIKVAWQYRAGQFTARYIANKNAKTPGASSRAKPLMRHLLPGHQ